MKALVCMFCWLFVCSCPSFAQEEEPPFLPNEGTLALGVASPFEKDPLNVPGEGKVPASFSFDVGYRRFLTPQMAVGIRGFGYVKSLPHYVISTTSDPSPRAIDFDLTAFNVGLEWFGSLPNGTVRPYMFLMILFMTGTVSNSEIGRLQYNGGGGGGGLGLRVEVSPTVALSLEGLGTWGAATWHERPFTNSTGDKFDPGMLGALLAASFRWP